MKTYILCPRARKIFAAGYAAVLTSLCALIFHAETLSGIEAAVFARTLTASAEHLLMSAALVAAGTLVCDMLHKNLVIITKK